MNLPTEAGPVRVLTEVSPDADMPIRAKVATGLALLTFFIFLPVVSCEFINYDDDVFITDNPKVAAGLTWEGIKWAFTSAEIDYWRPLSWLSHMLDLELFGPVAGAHHLVNLLIHCAAVVMAFLSLERLTRSVWPSALVAALFAWHPLHVESVAWVGERKDVLCGFFWFFTMWAYSRYVENPGPQRYLTVFAGFVLGVMSKPMIVTLPCVLLLLDYWPLKRIDAFDPANWKRDLRPATLARLSSLLKEKLPFFGVVMVLSLSTIYSQHRVGAMSGTEGLPLYFRTQNSVTSYATYLAQTVMPVDLCLLYPMEPVPAWRWQTSTLLVLTITLGSLLWARRHPFVLVGWLWYLGVLAPVAGILQVGEQAHADRYTYLPLTGVFIVVAWGGWRLTGDNVLRKKLLAWTAVFTLVACALVTRNQIRYWENSVTVFKHTAEVTSNNVSALNNLGAELLARNRPREAIVYLRETIRLSPKQKPWLNLTWAYVTIKDVERAQLAVHQAFSLDPKHPDATFMLERLKSEVANHPDVTLLHKMIALAYVTRGEHDAACSQLAEAIKVDPSDMATRVDRAAFLAMSGKEAEAMTVLEETVKLAPTNALAHSNLGALLGKQGRHQEALRHHLAAIQLNPANLDSRHNYAVMLARVGRLPDAKSEFEEVLRRHPRHKPAMQQLAWLLATREECRDGIKALSLASELISITSKLDAVQVDVLGAAAAAAGDFDKAVNSARTAIELAQQAKQLQLEKAISSRLRLYQSGRLFTETNTVSNAGELK